MKDLFGNANSWLGGDDDDDLPIVTGKEDDEYDGPPKSVMVLVCGECECRYGLPDEIDDVKLLEMCPRCASLFDSRGRFAIPASGERARAAMNQIE